MALLIGVALAGIGFINLAIPGWPLAWPCLIAGLTILIVVILATERDRRTNPEG